VSAYQHEKRGVYRLLGAGLRRSLGADPFFLRAEAQQQNQNG
jgi:hypothetical protein